MEQGKDIKLSTGNRIHIPNEFAEHLGWTPGMKLYLEVVGRSIVLRKVTLEVED